MTLSVSPALPVKSLEEFIAYARNVRPPLPYASIGNASQHQLVAERAPSGLEVRPWLALFSTAGTPAPVVNRLRVETYRLLGDADLRDKIRNVGGLEAYVTTPEEFAALLLEEHAKYGDIVKAAGAKID